MKKLIALGIVSGLALAAILGTGTMFNVLDAGERTSTISAIISEQAAPNTVDYWNREYAGDITESR